MVDYWKNDTGSNFIKKNCISLDLSVRRVRYEFFCFFFYFFLCLSPDPDAVRSGFYEIAKKMCGIPIYSGRMPLSEITENLVQWLRQEKISRNNPTRKYRCRKDTWNVFLFFYLLYFPSKIMHFTFLGKRNKQKIMKHDLLFFDKSIT